MATSPKIKLTIETKTETYQVIANPLALSNWETRFDKMLSDMANGISMTEIYGMGYEATRAAGKVVPGKFEDWLADLVDIDIDIEEPENPTEAAPSAE